jgi:DNA-binding beta-propeller fold protein YncE
MGNRNYDLTRRSLLASGMTILAAATGAACADTGRLTAAAGSTHTATSRASLSNSGNKLTVFSESGKQLWRLDAYGTGPGELNGAKDGLVRDNHVLVANSGNARVDVFELSGRYVGELSVPNDVTPFSRPMALAQTDNGIYVADSLSHAVYHFDTSLRFVETLGEGQLNGPSHLITTSEAELLVLDRGNHRIMKIDATHRLEPIAQPLAEFPNELQTFSDGSVAVFDLQTKRAHRLGFTEQAQV